MPRQKVSKPTAPEIKRQHQTAWRGHCLMEPFHRYRPARNSAVQKLVARYGAVIE